MKGTNLFNSVKLQRPKTSYFDLTHDVKLSFNMGELVPVCIMEALPTDKFNLSAESLVRLPPLTAPLMHRLDASIHYFFVPNRILWPGWEKFIANLPVTPGGTDVPVAPYVPVDLDVWQQSRLFDYMGIPKAPGTVGDHPAINISALPFAAYQKIYQDYYRDQNLIDQDDSSWTCVDGVNAFFGNPMFELRQRAWEHDYFTSCLPFAQKGPAVDIPLGDVTLKGPNNAGVEGKFVHATNHSVFATSGSATFQALNTGVLQDSGSAGTVYDPRGTLEVDATTINDLRRAFKLQEWFERNARSGTRYAEFLLAHFGQKVADSRLQRPEYICGIKTPIQISEVLNTTGTTELPQGNMSGHGIGVLSSNAGSYTVSEHGWIIGIMSVMPKTAYYQGIPRHFSRLTGFEQYAFPTFAHLGEQEVLNQEVYAYQADNEGTFGYNPRYSEYKYMPSRVAGDFRESLLFWHLARKFDTPPTLSQEFVECVPRTDIYAVEDPDVQKLWIHVLNKVGAVRPLPKYGNPKFG